MQPATRVQGKLDDDARDKASLADGIDTGSERIARDEFQDDANLHKIMQKFGKGGPMPPLRADGTYGFIDYGLDLQAAHQAIEDIQTAHLNLPDSLREKYPTWQHMLSASERGELGDQLKALQASQNEADREAAITAALHLDEARDKARRAKKAKIAADRAMLDDSDEPATS